MLNSLTSHKDKIINVIIIQNEHKIISVSLNGKIKIWDIDAYKLLNTIINDKIHVATYIAISQDGNKFFYAIPKGAITIWDVNSNKAIKKLKGQIDFITCIAINDKRNSPILIGGSKDKNVKIWNVKKRKKLNNLDKHSGSIECVAVSQNGNKIVSGSRDRTINIWDASRGELLKTLKGHIDTITSVAISQNGNKIVSGSRDRTINIWDASRGELLKTLKGHIDTITSVAISQDNSKIISSSRDKTVKVWDSKSGELLVSLDLEVIKIAYSNDFLLGATRSGQLFLWDIKDIYKPKKLKINIDAKSYITDLALTDKYLAFATRAGDLYFEEWGSGAVEQEVKRKEYTANRFGIKCLLLGDSGVGKTTFGNCLEYNVFDRGIVSTHAMHFFKKECSDNLKVNVARGGKVKKEEHNFYLDIWDFGGQPTYHIAHKQNFDKTRVVFLVIDLSKKGLGDNSVNYWCNSINEHYSDMVKEQLQVFVIGTKSKDEERLKEIENEVKEFLGNKIEVESKLFNEIEDESCGIEEIEKSIKEYIKNRIKIGGEIVIDDKASQALEKIKELQKRKFYVENKEELLKLLNSPLEKYDLKEHNSLDGSFDSVDIKNALKVLEESGSVERLDGGDYIILKPYWRNIFVNGILDFATSNSIVKASIGFDDLVNYKFEVKFDKPLKSEKEKKKDFINDEEIYEKYFTNAPKGLKDEFIKSVIKRLLEDKIAYSKDRMLVFPSRFVKKESFDTEGYFKADNIKIVSHKNVEVTMGKVVVSLYYSKEFTILKHSDKGVKVKDSRGNLYLVEFDRKDLSDDKKNQSETEITVYAKNGKADELISFILAILKDNLTSIYSNKRYKIKKGNRGVGDLRLTVLGDEKLDFGLIKCESLDGYKFEEKEFIKEYDRRLINELNGDIEEETNHVMKIVEKKIKDSSRGSKRKILHLSDLHINSNFNIDNEFNSLLKAIKDEKIDYIVLSGDITAKAEQRDYEIAYKFTKKLMNHFELSPQQVIVVPGNHDYNRAITLNAYSVETMRENKFKDRVDFRINEKVYLRRNEDAWKERFKNFSEYFYEPLYHQSYSSDTAKQTKIIEDDNISFVLLNTSIKIDHFYPLEVDIDLNSFISAASRVKNSVKIAVGHHPINYERSYEFVEHLNLYEFDAYMHGHVHRNNLISFDDLITQNIKKRLMYIGAGLFWNYSPTSMRPGVPLRFNIVTVCLKEDKDKSCDRKSRISVKTYERENQNSTWREAFIYPTANNKRSSVWNELECD